MAVDSSLEFGTLRYQVYESLADFLNDEVPFADSSSAVQLEPGNIRIDSWRLGFQDLQIYCQRTERSLSLQPHNIEGWSQFGHCRSASGLPWHWQGMEVNEHQFILTQEGKDHLTLPAHSDMISIIVDDQLLDSLGVVTSKKVAEQHSTQSKIGMVVDFPESLHLRLIQVFDQLWNKYRGVAPHRAVISQEDASIIRLTVFDVLTKSFGHKGSTASQKKPLKRYSLTRRSLEYISQHALGREKYLTLEELCEAVGASPRTLQRAFRDVLGITPYRYLLQVRLNAAHDVLRDPLIAKTVSDIAADYGFCSGSEFAQHYTKIFGCSPSQTRRRLTR